MRRVCDRIPWWGAMPRRAGWAESTEESCPASCRRTDLPAWWRAASVLHAHGGRRRAACRCIPAGLHRASWPAAHPSIPGENRAYVPVGRDARACVRSVSASAARYRRTTRCPRGDVAIGIATCHRVGASDHSKDGICCTATAACARVEGARTFNTRVTDVAPGPVGAACRKTSLATRFAT